MQSSSSGRRGLAAALAVLTAGVTAVAAAPAGAAVTPVTIGHTIPGAFAACGIGSSDTWADPVYAVTGLGGTITSFSINGAAADAGQSIDFLVLRPTSSSTQYTVVGSSGLQTLAGNGADETFPASTPIAVKSGDILGFYLPSGLHSCVALSPGGDIIYTPSASDPASGTSDVVFANSFGGAALNLAASMTPVGPVVGSGTTASTTKPNTFTISSLDGTLTYSDPGSGTTFNGTMTCGNFVGNAATVVAFDSATGYYDRTMVQDNGASGDKLINTMFNPANLVKSNVAKLESCVAPDTKALTAAPALSGDPIQIDG